MYITHSFIGIKREHFNYLFFYLSEDYAEGQKELSEKIHSLLEYLARELKENGAVIKPFTQDNATTQKEIIEKWTDKFAGNLFRKTPGLLIINSDFETFNPSKNSWVFISFRDYMDDYGKLEIFRIQELINILIKNSSNDNLIDELSKKLRKEKIKREIGNLIEIKPNMFGFSIDIEKGLSVLKNLTQNKK